MAMNYYVKQGDCIFSIAFEQGFFPDTIWNHPNNADLKKMRKDPSVLLPGDTVFVPDKQLKEVSKPTNEVHKFRCKNTPKILSIQIVRMNKPIRNMDYKLDIDGVVKEGKTDSEGWLKQPIAPNANLAKLILADGVEYELSLGYLDPIDKISGIQGRLHNLGYYDGDITDELNGETKEALEIFQRSHDLEVTGAPDEKTKALLVRLTGA